MRTNGLIMKKIFIVFFIFASSFLSVPNISAQDSNNSTNLQDPAEIVKMEFLHSWDAYKKYAWGHDELKPLSKMGYDWYGTSFYMTPVDAFDTMILMGLTIQAKEAKELILNNLNFDKDVFVQNFEINIRLLGGLLSAYEFDGDKHFLALAEDLGKRLLPVFSSNTGMPYVYVNIKTGETRDEINNPAEIGTLMLEFGTLSRLTGNDVYYNSAKRAVVEVFNRRSEIGLVGTSINVNTGEWTNTESHISGMIDSYYEYLLKSWLLFKDQDFKDMYDTGIAAVNRFLPDTVDSRLWYGKVDMYTGQRTSTTFGALDAFMPAVLSLGGDLNKAELLQESCFYMWQHFGIEPEEFNYKTMEFTYPDYVLRPENVESAYYLYHFTGETRYREMGDIYLKSIMEYCRLDEGYASLQSVVTKQKSDSMPSFFLAETLKYLYLLFTDASVLNFNDIIFNTEAHPLYKEIK
jgi:mannosidase alpha-like ER degradation enhancer 2